METEVANFLLMVMGASIALMAGFLFLIALVSRSLSLLWEDWGLQAVVATSVMLAGLMAGVAFAAW